MPKPDHRAKLAELRALRQSGKKSFETYRVDDAPDLYDEVDEDGYKKIVRSRLNEDDFVVDDNGEGYADDGREDWDRVRHYESDSDLEDLPVRGRAGKEGLCSPCHGIEKFTPVQPTHFLHSQKEAPRYPSQA